MIKEFRKQTVGLVSGAFGFIAALAWNDAIKAFIDSFYENPGEGVSARFIYAIVITIIVVVVTVQLMKFAGSEEDK